MKGKCVRCGCTEDSPCPGGCSWADEREDLCDRCAAAIVGEPVPENDLAGLTLHYRAFMAVSVFAFSKARAELEELRQPIYQLAGAEETGELSIEVPSPIWTPGGEA